MNILQIDRLLNKYFDGETSIREEEELRLLLKRPDLPKQYIRYREMFDSLQQQKEIGLDGDFDEKFLNHIASDPGAGIRFLRKINWYIVSAAAAVVLLMVILFVPVGKLPFLNQFSSAIEDTFDDPEKAYAVTVKTLFMVSERFNKGSGQMAQMSKFNNGLADASPMTKLSEGLNTASPISKFDDSMNELSFFEKISSALTEAGKLSLIDKNN